MSHPTNHISDYVLGLADTATTRQINAHLARCADCRHRVQMEREIGSLVRSTVSAITPSQYHLMGLMPALPSSSSSQNTSQNTSSKHRKKPMAWSFAPPLRIAVASFALLLVLFVGSVSFSPFSTVVEASPSAPAFAPAYTMTETPTLTATATTIADFPIPIATPAIEETVTMHSR